MQICGRVSVQDMLPLFVAPRQPLTQQRALKVLPHARSPGGRQWRPAEHRWRQPPAHWPLRLDQAALAVALEAGPPAAAAEQGRRVYVSRATLVVVPPTLVGHWTHQIAAHTAPGVRLTLRSSEPVVCNISSMHCADRGAWAAVMLRQFSGRGGCLRLAAIRLDCIACVAPY